jgi:hypothetical protein
VGKAQDIKSWIDGKYEFVLGIDIDENNIKSRIDGACKRYLDEKISHYVPLSFFLVGDSGKHIKSWDAAFGGGSADDCFKTDEYRTYAKIIFGVEEVKLKDSGKGIISLHGKAKNGFNVCSCQFALHYMFENIRKLHTFIQNISECLNIDGYFIATCFDGDTIFNYLTDCATDESKIIYKTDEKTGIKKRIFEIVKKYDETAFPNTAESVGYSIDIYQESINAVNREYLVNFIFFKELMAEYGFEICTADETEQIGFVNGTGLFDELYKQMIHDKEFNSSFIVENMSDEEKTISFFNRYFIFKKKRNVDIKEIQKRLVMSSTATTASATATASKKEKKTEKIRKLDKVKKVVIKKNMAEFIL